MKFPFLPFCSVLPLVITIIFTCSGCSGLAGNTGEEKTAPQKMYIDATRNFAVEFPGDWIRYVGEEEPIVRAADSIGWKSPVTEAGTAVARMHILIPHEPLDREDAQNRVRENLSGFTLKKSEDIKTGGLGGIDLHGDTSRKNYRIVMLGDPVISYILIYSALPEYFKEYRSQFKDMVRSFEVLQ